MKRLKILSLVLVMCMLLSNLGISAYADNHRAQLVPVGNDINNPIVFANSNLNFSLSANGVAKSGSTYYITSSDTLVIDTLTWSPSGETVYVGFENKQTGARWVHDFDGGSTANVGVTLGSAPDGEYYVIVMYMGSASVSGALSYKFM